MTGFSSGRGGGGEAGFLSKIGVWIWTGGSGTEGVEAIPGEGAKPLCSAGFPRLRLESMPR
jgi:hypothetical protein